MFSLTVFAATRGIALPGAANKSDAVFATRALPAAADAIAPDGSAVRVMLGLTAGSVAHFELPPGEVSVAVRHRTVEEIWYFVSGHGEMWRRHGEHEATVNVSPGVCLTIPRGTDFQFRAHGVDPLTAVGVTMPPWPGDGEAIRSIGPWAPTRTPGPGLAER